MLEKTIEKRLRDKVKNELNGMALKMICKSFYGFPDRTILLPGGIIRFVECKAPGKVPTKLQAKVISILKHLGFIVLVIDTIEGVDLFIAQCKKDLHISPSLL